MGTAPLVSSEEFAYRAPLMGQRSRFYTRNVWRSVYPLSGKQCSDFKFGLKHPSQRGGWLKTEQFS
jgi:hypothetical protein